MSERYIGSAFRGTCPECGETKTDKGADAADAAIMRHRLEKHMTTIIEKAWAQLDEQVDEIMALHAEDPRNWAEGRSIEDELAAAKARARGKAEILALLTTPFYPTADAVAVEATRRYQERQAGREPATKGLGVVWQPGGAS